MRSVNKVILVGNITRDPKIKETPNGQKMTSFGIATNRLWTTKDGQSNNLAEFHEVVAWSKLAELCEKYLRKGKLVYVEGYLKTRKWDDENGNRFARTEVVISDMIMLNKRDQNANDEIQDESEQEEMIEEATDVKGNLDEVVGGDDKKDIF